MESFANGLHGRGLPQVSLIEIDNLMPYIYIGDKSDDESGYLIAN
jgi:hypothetical protein